MTSTSDAEWLSLPSENRRLRLERWLQVASYDYDLRFEFGDRDFLSASCIVLREEGRSEEVVSFSLVKGRALRLLGHYLSQNQSYHEAAHQEESQNKPFFYALWHALEDARIENLLVQRFPGAQKLFTATLLPSLGGSLFRLMKPIEQLKYGLYFEGRGYSGAQYGSKVLQVIEQIRPDILQAANSESARQTLQVMVRIYPLLTHLMPLTRRGKGRHSQDSQPREDEDQPQSKNSTKKQNDPNLDSIPEIETSADLVSVGVQVVRREFPAWFKPGSMPWLERGIGKKEIYPSALQSSSQTIVIPPKGDLTEYQTLYDEVQRETGFLTQRLITLIREKVYLRYGGYYRTGKLNKAKLWKQRIGDYQLFHRQIEGGSRVAAFTLLVDESASMKGQNKFILAKKAALLLGETFTQIRLPLEIIGFTTHDFEARAAMKLGLTPAHRYRTVRCSALEHRIYKRFDEPYHAIRTRLTDIQPRHNNWDEEHLFFAYQRIQSRPERKKVIIVICDGQPNGDANHLIRTVRRVESLGVKTIGVGIGADYVKEIYSHAIVVSDFRQMSEELLHILGREFQIELI